MGQHFFRNRSGGPEHLPLARRPRQFLDGESLGFHGPANGTLGAIGNQQAARGEQTEGLGEARLGPEFGLAVRCKSVEVDEVKGLFGLVGEGLPIHGPPCEPPARTPLDIVPWCAMSCMDGFGIFGLDRSIAGRIQRHEGRRGNRVGFERGICDVRTPGCWQVAPDPQGEEGIQSGTEPQFEYAQCPGMVR